MKIDITLRQSQALRGIAILGIILHNYCHFLKFAVKENEYTFSPEKPRQLLEKLSALDGDLFIHVLSFFGHYGVPVFLFVSGYGLVRKYEAPLSAPKAPPTAPDEAPPSAPEGATNVPAHNAIEAPSGAVGGASGAVGGASGALGRASGASSGAFLWRHFKKLFRLMIWGYLLFVAVYFLRNGNGAEVYGWDRVAAQLTMTVNFLYEHPDRVIKPGPYWFFGLMLQLYALYIFVIHRWRNRWLLLGLAVGCWLVQVAMPTADALNFVRYNFVGGVLPFVAGVWVARAGLSSVPSLRGTEGGAEAALGETTVSALCVFVAMLFVFAGSFWFHSWLWVPLFVVIGAVATVRLLPEWLLKPCAWVGGISASLFVMHPLLRELIIPHYRHTDIYYGIVVYVLASVAAAMLLSWLTAKKK